MKIEDYGLIGNMNSAALVGRNGAIDWLCLPHFDSRACFAALLGDSSNGMWRIAPKDGFRTARRYIPDTAVLETTFETATGVCRLIDFMPLTDDNDYVNVVRIVLGEQGEVALDMELVLRFNYGQAVPWVRRRDYGLSAVAGPDAVELHTTIPLSNHDMKTRAQFIVREGDEAPFTLSYHPSYKQPQFVPDRSETLARTVAWWQEWSKRCNFDIDETRWRDAVVRSLITLKLLTFRPTGGIVAAPTTSLPELIGGSRNWDYRYCWLRDSAFTLYAFLNAGYREEAEAWRQWLLRAAAGHPQQLRIMYGIKGERWLPESELPWLPGYEASKPVRIGNLAAGHLQLDVFGELIDTLHAGREAELAPSEEAWRLENVLLDHLQAIWRSPDQGIWEVRGPPRMFTHSRLMCWVAFDRAIKSIEHFGLKGDIEQWKTVRTAIHDEVCDRGFDRELNSFVQVYDERLLDASLLLIPQVGFLPPDDPRVLGTIAAVERELVNAGFVARYATHEVNDGVGGGEGAFLACSYWLADAYAMAGRRDEAVDLFERLLDVRNDLGLLAEEYCPASKRLVGNFPQGFSHIGLVNTAYNLLNRDGPANQRSQRTAPPSRRR